MYKPLAVLFMIIGILSGCQNSSKNSYIIIATDQLSFQDSNCSRDWTEQNSGISLLCRESVRWTHAFTTSLLSGPALSSVLTGLHPRKTGYHHHAQYLEPQFKNIAQVALQKKYRTAFFSGGPPILKKSGLDSGFELFDDSLNLSKSPFLKPFRESIHDFSDWLKNEVGGSPFFVTFYVPDLRFVTRTTTTPLGEARNKSFESQLEEFDTVLYDLIVQLKKNNRWDKTHVILVGLQGRNLYDRQNVFTHLNLHSENSQVALLWKPAQKKRDAPVSWTMDKNISLADVGKTLFDLFNETPKTSTPPAASLAITLTQPQSSFDSSRIHLIESAWGKWKFGTPTFSALLDEEELYFHSTPAALFRTLSDRLEINPLVENPNNQNLFIPYKEEATELGLRPFVQPRMDSKKNSLLLWNLSYEDWLSPKFRAILEQLQNVKPQEIPPESRAWFARSLIENGEWKKLKSVAESWNNQNYLWLATKNLNLPKMKHEPPCLQLVKSTSLSGADVKKCSDTFFIETLYSLEGVSPSKKWEKILEDKLTMVQILRTNRALGAIWDVTESSENILSLTEILFWTPEFRNLLRPIQKKIHLVELESP
jgi:hypothetical protein